MWQIKEETAKVFTTSDGQCFRSRQLAEEHILKLNVEEFRKEIASAFASYNIDLPIVIWTAMFKSVKRILGKS